MSNSDNVEILLIDGDPATRNELALRLRRKGLLIDMAKNGFHAIKEIEENNFKLVIISNHMEDMGIGEMVTIIRSMKGKGDIPLALYAPPIDDNIVIDELITDLGVNHIILSRDFSKLMTKVSKYVEK